VQQRALFLDKISIFNKKVSAKTILIKPFFYGLKNEPFEWLFSTISERACIRSALSLGHPAMLFREAHIVLRTL